MVLLMVIREALRDDYIAKPSEGVTADHLTFISKDMKKEKEKEEEEEERSVAFWTGTQ